MSGLVSPVLAGVAVAVVTLLGAVGLALRAVRRQAAARQSVESRLAESERRLRLAMSAARAGAWHWDAATNQTTRDADLNRLMGLEPVETTAPRTELLDRLHADDRAAARAALDDAIRDRRSYTAEYRVVTPAGIRWIRETGRPFFDEGGAIAYATGVAIDVTDEHEALDALRLSQERFAKAFAASPDCIAICDFDGVVEINDRYESMTGYPRDHIIGRNIVEAGLLADGSVRDEFLRRLKADGGVRQFETTLTRRDGAPLLVSLSAFLLELGGRPHFLAVARDITKQVAAEEALRQSELRYRDLVENAHDMIFTVDARGAVRSMNRAGVAVTGRRGAHPGVDLRTLLDPGDAELTWQLFAAALAGRDVPPFEAVFVDDCGRRTSAEVSVRPVPDQATAAVQCIARDIGARRDLEAQLRQAQKMDAIGRLAAGVAHDFNNLLTVILAHCEASRRQLAPGDPLAPAVEGIAVAAERAAALTGQLLAFSRRQVTQPQAVRLNAVVTDIQSMVTRLIGEDVSVITRLEPELGHVNADAGQLQQVLLNLAVNARDAMPNGGRLIIETRNVHLGDAYVQRHPQMPTGEYVALVVSDSGVGMDAETMAHIFEPFYTTKTLGKGTGLGLATVYGIVKQAGGYIWAYSEPGVGTTFKVYLPRVDAPVDAPALPRPLPQGPITGDETVLLVEDEAELRQILEDFLTSQGYTVVSAADGPACLAACRDRGSMPGLLVTDVVMPSMSGRELADQLRAVNPALKVLYLSGYTDDAVLRHGIRPGGDTHFLQKPFALHDLALRVRALLDSTQASAAPADLA